MALFWPGLKSQLLTTREPEPRHIEVALVALRSVLDLEAGKPTETQEPQAAIN
jgi:uncharacterized protein YqhQ